MRVRLLIALLLSALWLTSLSFSSVAQQPAPSPSRSVKPPPVLTKLPPSVLDAQLKSAGGYTLKLSNYSGKVLVVALWATWCEPCRTQLEALVKIHERFGFQVEIIGLSTEPTEESAEATRAFISENSIPFEIGWTTPEVATTLMQGRDAIPQTFVVSRTGRIVKRLVGFSSTGTSRQVEEAIEVALKETQDPPAQ
jgi:peroxiredoxin